MNEQIQAYMYEIVKKFFDGGFDGEKWNYDIHDELLFSADIGGLGGKFDELKLTVTIGNRCVTCYHTLPVKVPAELHPAICEYITRANYGLMIGNFEMDFRDGELRYKTTLSSNDLLSDETNAHLSMIMLVTIGAKMWQRYGDNLAALLFGFDNGRSIEELIEQSESAEIQ